MKKIIFVERPQARTRGVWIKTTPACSSYGTECSEHFSLNGQTKKSSMG